MTEKHETDPNELREQWEAIDRRFRNLVRQESKLALLRRMEKLETSDPSQSKSDTTLDTSGEQSMDGESHRSTPDLDGDKLRHSGRPTRLATARPSTRTRQVVAFSTCLW